MPGPSGLGLGSDRVSITQTIIWDIHNSISIHLIHLNTLVYPYIWDFLVIICVGKFMFDPCESIQYRRCMIQRTTARSRRVPMNHNVWICLDMFGSKCPARMVEICWNVPSWWCHSVIYRTRIPLDSSFLGMAQPEPASSDLSQPHLRSSLAEPHCRRFFLFCMLAHFRALAEGRSLWWAPGGCCFHYFSWGNRLDAPQTQTFLWGSIDDRSSRRVWMILPFCVFGSWRFFRCFVHKQKPK